MRALISIHDVMPETLPRVTAWLDRLRRQGHSAVTLLVVPGRDWSASDLATLADWQHDGIELAAHGWSHRAHRMGGLFHRLHAAFLSRRAAEHLALDPAGIEQLMQAAADWFPRHGLAAPETYVPPAWALGAIRRSALRRLPYRQIEVTRGLLDVDSGWVRSLPLVGFEADTPLREHSLRAWNRVQRRWALARGLPLRIGIHPTDDALGLAGDLDRLLAEPWQSLRCRDYAAEWRVPPAT